MCYQEYSPGISISDMMNVHKCWIQPSTKSALEMHSMPAGQSFNAPSHAFDNILTEIPGSKSSGRCTPGS